MRLFRSVFSEDITKLEEQIVTDTAVGFVLENDDTLVASFNLLDYRIPYRNGRRIIIRITTNIADIIILVFQNTLYTYGVLIVAAPRDKHLISHLFLPLIKKRLYVV